MKLLFKTGGNKLMWVAVSDFALKQSAGDAAPGWHFPGRGQGGVAASRQPPPLTARQGNEIIDSKRWRRHEHDTAWKSDNRRGNKKLKAWKWRPHTHTCPVFFFSLPFCFTSSFRTFDGRWAVGCGRGTHQMTNELPLHYWIKREEGGGHLPRTKIPVLWASMWMVNKQGGSPIYWPLYWAM